MTRPNLRDLAGSISRKQPATAGGLIAAVAGGHPTEAPVSDLTPHPGNIRGQLADLTELVDSIKAQGIIQPLVVVPADDYRRHNPTAPEVATPWVVIAGHRRLAAARQAGLDSVPIAVSPELAEPGRAITAMLIENMQRNSLTPLDEAAAFAMLADTGMSQRDISAATGVAQGTVSKRLKLLSLDEKAQQALTDGVLTVDVALDLLSLPQKHRAGVLARGIATGDIRAVITREKQRQARPKPQPKPKPTPKPPAPAEGEPGNSGGITPQADQDTSDGERSDAEDHLARQLDTTGSTDGITRDVAWPSDDRGSAVLPAAHARARERIDQVTGYLAVGSRPGAARLLADLVLAAGLAAASPELMADLLGTGSTPPEPTSQADAIRQAIATLVARAEHIISLGADPARYEQALRRAGIIDQEQQ